MYYSLEGVLAEKHATQVVLDVNGVGYELLIPLSTFSKLPETGKKLKLLTYFHVREDAQQLFGFYSREEKDLFRLLLSVSGVGPKVALAVLSGIGIEEFKQAIVNGNLTLLHSISGVGKKIAERLVVELREKIALEMPSKKKVSSSVEFLKNGQIAEDSLQALMNLGYRRNEVQEALKEIFSRPKSESLKVEEVIREALKVI